MSARPVRVKVEDSTSPALFKEEGHKCFGGGKTGGIFVNIEIVIKMWNPCPFQFNQRVRFHIAAMIKGVQLTIGLT